MSSEFLDRNKSNKQKGLLALLLLLLRWRRGTGAVLLIILLVLWLMVGPRNAMALMIAGAARLPGGARIAASLQWVAAKAGLGPEQHSFQELLAGFKSAREHSRSSGWAAVLGGPVPRGSGTSIDMIRGGADDFNAGANLATKISGGKTVSGILTPEESKKDGAGAVALSEGDIRGERAGIAQGSGRSGRAGDGGEAGDSGAAGQGLAGGFSDATGMLGASGAYTTKNMWSTHAGQAAGAPDSLKTALDSTKVPGVKTARFPGERGKLSADGMRAVRASQYRAGLRNSSSRGMRALAQLADGRTRAMMSRTPYCGPENGCPQEFAATNVGAVFDGNNVSEAASNIIRTDVPALDGTEVPAAPPAPGGGGGDVPGMPSTGDLDAMQNEANDLVDDAEKCREAQESEEYRGAMQAGQDCISARSAEMNALDCGGCDNADECRAKSREIRACCDHYEEGIQYMRDHCPLNAEDSGASMPSACEE